MFETKLKSVIELEAKAREARVELENTRIAELKAMPARYGYATLEEFIKALKDAAGKRSPKGSRKAKGKAAATAAAPKKAAGKRKRAKITEELRAAIIADLKAGTKTAVAISKEHGVSYPSIMLIKKAAGLVGAAAPAAS